MQSKMTLFISLINQLNEFVKQNLIINPVFKFYNRTALPNVGAELTDSGTHLNVPHHQMLDR